MKPIIKIIVVGLGVRGKHWMHVINNNTLALITAFVDINPLSKDDISKSIIYDIPFFTSFTEALEEVESKAQQGDWVDASNSLKQITDQLQSYEKSLSEALELYTFIEAEWNNLRNRLESSNIKANDEMRLNAEKNISECKRFLDEGDIDSTLDSLGDTDMIIENLRRRI